MEIPGSGFRFRAVAVALAVIFLSVGNARAGSTNLWITYNGGGDGIEKYGPKQLGKSGSPTPTLLGAPFPLGLAFDKSHNLWAVVFGPEVVEFTAAQLKNLKNNPNPTPAVVIASTDFIHPGGCNFDSQGNLWIADYSNDSIDELSKAQLASSNPNITPNLIITSPQLFFPIFVAFDKAGNAWLDNVGNQTIVKFSASQLTSGGSKPASVVLSDDGSGTSLNAPEEIAFDKKGNLWVANYTSDTVVKYGAGQLNASGNPAPTVKLSSAIFDGPTGVAFDSKGELAVMNYNDGAIAKFTAKQLKTSGAPVPKVSVTGTAKENSQIVFGPAS